MKASAIKAERGMKARQSGRRAELWAAAWLMLKGYRILGFRLKTPQGEIDILAQRGKVLAVIEVKLRLSLADALEAVSTDQRLRLHRAARELAARRPYLREAEVRLDLIALAPGRWPRHIRAAWPDDGL
ncbi:MAG: hypothetical protein RJA87_190 [Pseudomonadota bacterium]